MVPRSRGLGLSPAQGHCVVLLSKTLTLTVALSTQDCKWEIAGNEINGTE